jgi:hypothetical protein
MAQALIGTASFVVNYASGGAQYRAHVCYEQPDGRYNESDILVPVQSGDTGAAFQARLMTAIDTEATRIGLAAPTAIYGHSLSKFR